MKPLPQYPVSQTKKVWLVMPTLNRYQSARYAAFARGRADTGVFELSGSGSYDLPDWRSPQADKLPNVVTLFPEINLGDIPPRELCATLRTVLAAHREEIGALAVMGWEDRAALTALEWAIQQEVPTILMSESNEFDAARSRVKESLKRRIVCLFSAGLAGGSAAGSYMEKLGLAKEKILLGYDVVDNTYFARRGAEVRNQSSKMRESHGLPQCFFLASGRLVAKKNLSRLVQAYARYRVLCAKSASQGSPSQTPWDLVILGGGPLQEEVRAEASALGLTGCVQMPGAKPYEDLPAFYGLASAFVHGSTVEQWGLVVNEAMASGLPVLVSNRCGCASDLVQEGINGFTFDPLDVEQLAGLMHQLTETPKPQLTRMSSASREIVRRWSPEVFAENLWKAVQIAISKPRPQAGWIDRLLLCGLLNLRR